MCTNKFSTWNHLANTVDVCCEKYCVLCTVKFYSHFNNRNAISSNRIEYDPRGTSAMNGLSQESE